MFRFRNKQLCQSGEDTGRLRVMLQMSRFTATDRLESRRAMSRPCLAWTLGRGGPDLTDIRTMLADGEDQTQALRQ